MSPFRLQILSSLILGILFLAFAVSPSRLSAQAMPTQFRTNELSAFGGYASSSPDFATSRDTGGTLGVNFTRFFHFPVAPSLELRANFASGPVVNETSYLLGIRAQGSIAQRFHPYVNLLAGTGKISYANPPLPSEKNDSGTVFSYGLGIDIDVAHSFLVKADFQDQSWNLGVNGTFKPQGGDYTLTPQILLIGIAYRIPFHTRNQ